jgi:hypothetical protein
MNGGLEKICEEAVVGVLKASRHSPGGNEKSHEYFQPG